MQELEIVQHRRIEGLSVFFDTVDYRTPHAHPEWELLYILEEELAVGCAGRRLTARPGDMLLFAPDQTHEFHKTGESCTFLCVQAIPSLLGVERELTLDEPLVAPRFAPEEYRALGRELRDLAEAYFRRPPYYRTLCVGKLSLLFYRLLSHMPCRPLSAEEAQSSNKRSRRLAALLRFVDENYQHKIRLSDFAREQGCSLSHMSHAVKATLNQSFQEYVRTVRVNAACQQIAAGGKRMLDICLDSGFSDYRYFSRAFREQFGMTPEQYSRQRVKPLPEGTAVRHSLHSLERFYDDEQSLRLLDKLPFG